MPHKAQIPIQDFSTFTLSHMYLSIHQTFLIHFKVDSITLNLETAQSSVCFYSLYI